MSIILTGFQEFLATVPTKTNLRILQNPIARGISFYKMPLETKSVNYSNFNFGANGNQTAATMPILSSGQNILTGVQASALGRKAGFVVSGHAIEYTRLEEMDAQRLGYNQFDVKSAALANLVSKYYGDTIVGGIPALGADYYGLINNPSVSKAPVSSGKKWTDAGTTAAEIIADVTELQSSITIATSSYVNPDTLILGVTNYAELRKRVMPTTNLPLEQHLKLTYGIKDIIAVSDSLTTISGKQRMAMYENNEGMIKAAYAEIGTYNTPPTQQGLMFSQPFLFGIGVPEIYEQASIAYRDFP